MNAPSDSNDVNVNAGTYEDPLAEAGRSAGVHARPEVDDGHRAGAVRTFRRLALPVGLGLLLIAALVAQARGLRQRASGDADTLAGGGGHGRQDEASAAAGAMGATGGTTSGAADPGGAWTSGTAGTAATRVAAEGRLVAYPGAQVMVGSDLAGTVVRLAVQEKQVVRRGQLLAELRADDLRSQLAEARARVAETEADLRFAARDAERARYLSDQHAGTEREAERTASGRDAALARIETARSEVRRLDAVLAKTRILAPIDGTVVERAVQSGEHVEAGTALLTLADLRRTRVEAEVDEFDAGHVALGAPVRVSVEGYDGRSWRAHVEEIPDSVVARRLRPQDPGRPADTRVLLVKIALDEPHPIKLGQRVEVAIAPPPPRRLMG
jgi:HlyD family secretion protein